MSGSRLWVLSYHRVLEPSQAADCDPALISATPAAFDRQMCYLAEHHDVVSAEQLVAALREGRPLPQRAVWITFDDGYRDFGEVAWPILRRYRLPATLFVPTAYPGDRELRFWWDRLYCAFTGTRLGVLDGTPAGRLPLHTPKDREASLRALQGALKRTPHWEAMRVVDEVCERLGADAHAPAGVHTWHELRELAGQGVTVGAHTRTHPALTQLSLEQARAEIQGSRDDLSRELGATVPVFAYPFGEHDARVAQVSRDAGVALAVTCRAGCNRIPGDDPVRLRRVHIGGRTTPLVFRIRLTAAGATLDRWRERHCEWRGRAARRPGPGAAAPVRAPLKLAYIMSRFPKLSETFVLNEMLTLSSLGIPVELYPLLRERQPVAHAEVAAWVERAHFHPFISWPILRANAHFLRRQPAAYVRLWREVLRKTMGSPNFFIGALGIFPKAVRFAYEMRRDGVTHVHAHFATHPAVAALIINRLTGISFSFTAHGSDLHVDRRMLDTKLAAAAFAVTVSAFNKRVMVGECGVHLSDKIHIIHCGVDPDFFAPAARNSTEPLRIVCVASLEAVKGHAYLLEACRLLQDRGVDFRCDLVGEGPLRRVLEGAISRHGLGHRVRLCGGRPRAEVARMLATADVAVLTSHPTREGKREGIPVALMEAMAAGLPVVASAISGIPELVESEVTGLLVPSGDPRAIADALERLDRDGDLRARLGSAARGKVLQDFDLRANTRALGDLFVDAGRDHRRAPAAVADIGMQSSSLPAAAGAEPPVAPPAAGGAARAYFRGSSFLLVGRFVSVVLNFGVQVLTVRYLAKSDYGAFAYALAVVSITSSAILLGLGKAIPRLVPIYHERQDYPRVFGFIVLAFGTVFGLGVSLVVLLHGLRGLASSVIGDPASLSLLLVLIALAPVEAVDHLLQQLVAVFASPRAIFVRRHVLGPGLKLAAILVVMASAGDARMLAFGYLAGGMIGIWLYVTVLMREWRKQGLLRHMHPRRLHLAPRELFGFSVPLLSAELAVLWRSSLTVFILGYLSTTAAVAEFRAVVSVAGLNMLVSEAFLLLFVPHASRMFARADRAGISDLYWQTSLWVAVLTFPILLATCFLAQPVTLLLFGERYGGGGVLLAILAAGHYVNAVLGFNSSALQVHGKVRFTLVSDVLAAVLVVIANVLLIPPYGALGAAIATTGAVVLHNLFNHIALWLADTGVRLLEWQVVRIHLVVISLTAVLLLGQQLVHPPVEVSVAIAAVAVVLVAWVTRHALRAQATFPELLRIPWLRRLLA